MNAFKLIISKSKVKYLYDTDEFEQGSGLGLAISKVIIERLSGRIEVHSEKGKGSCFAVILSLADVRKDHLDELL